MAQERLFASFMLDRRLGLEIALPAEQVVEAIGLDGPVMYLPSASGFLEGLMHFREDVIALINLKKRLGLADTAYGDDPKVAVIQLGRKQYGLLFDDIRDVLRVQLSSIERIESFLTGEEGIVTDLIKLDHGRRVLELLDTRHLFPGLAVNAAEEQTSDSPSADSERVRIYSQYVVFSSGGQDYGVPVEDAREICFIRALEEIFKDGVIEGALQLRGNTISILSGACLLGNWDVTCDRGEDARILIVQLAELSFGITVDRIREIIFVADDEVLPMPRSDCHHIRGIFPYASQRNIMLLDVADLIDPYRDKIQDLNKISERQLQASRVDSAARHVITEHCYLVFSIGRDFAIELKDVQEIIESGEVLRVPEDYNRIDGIINLRGDIVPVLDLRRFYDTATQSESRQEQVKLIIGRAGEQRVAMIVDEIKTIYKHEKYHATPSLKPGLQEKKDTLDRIIEFVRDDGVKEHVLVINVANIIVNHLQLTAPSSTITAAADAKE